MASEVYLNAGGVEVKVTGEIDASTVFALWEKMLDRVANGRNVIGAGSGFAFERAESAEEPPGESDMPECQGAGLHLIRPSIESRDVAPFDAKPKNCFHPWPGCNC